MDRARAQHRRQQGHDQERAPTREHPTEVGYGFFLHGWLTVRWAYVTRLGGGMTAELSQARRPVIPSAIPRVSGQRVKGHIGVVPLAEHDSERPITLASILRRDREPRTEQLECSIQLALAILRTV